MQEEVENRTLTLVVSGTKFTGRMFKAAISKYMAHRKEKKLEKQRSRDAPVIYLYLYRYLSVTRKRSTHLLLSVCMGRSSRSRLPPPTTSIRWT